MDYPLLNSINSPNDLKSLGFDNKALLCNEIRDKIINTVASKGGHLASNLGAVELTVALHSVFDSPADSIIFDVGHQCYTHKLLTGRFDRFDTLRENGGLAGFPKPCESEHDKVISGHSSTSISTALGIAKGNTLSGNDAHSIAVIGDGAMTGGMAFEALNNVGKDDGNLIIILNDNKMSISHNVGGFAQHLAVIRSRPSYYRFKRGVENTLGRIPLIGKGINRALVSSKNMLKNAIYHSNMFEEFGIHYLGPVDGHNLEQLDSVMKIAKAEKRPVLIHAITTKGKGYPFAEKNPGAFHGIGSFDCETGEVVCGSKSFSDLFGECICAAAAKSERVCAITAAMASGTGLNDFRKRYKDRFFDVGIAEQHAVTFCAGLAVSGIIPIFAVYSSFLQRGIDQVIHDAAIGNLHIVLCIDRAGFVGEDGETHQGLFDVPLLSSIPNVKIYSPSNFDDFRYCFNKAVFEDGGVVAVRYPRGSEPSLREEYIAPPADLQLFKNGGETLLITYGREFASCADAAENAADVLKLIQISPIPENALNLAKNYKKILFFEESMQIGGIGERFGAMLLEQGFNGEYRHIAVQNEYVSGASVKEQVEHYHLDSESVSKVLCEPKGGDNIG